MGAKTICILGGTGFIGRHVANRLTDAGYRVRIVTPRRYRGRDLLVLPDVELHEADIQDERELVRQFTGCAAVINLVGVRKPRRGDVREHLHEAHVELPRRALSAVRRAGVPRLLHMSALGADPDAASLYHRTKGEGERAVLAADPYEVAVTVFRPAPTFGPEDRFLTRLALWLRLAPGILLLPAPQARLQPVYAGDVARAFLAALEDARTSGRAFELCGPTVYTLRELAEYTAELRRLRRRVVGLSDALSRLAARVAQRLPGRPYTLDEYRATIAPNCCSEDGLAELGIRPTALEAVAPTYIGTESQQERYQRARAAAGR